MRMIFRLIFVLVIADLFGYAKIVQGSISCATSQKDDVKEVYVYVNGINNDLDEAEVSRQLLSKKLEEKMICTPLDYCAVKKFYNSTQGLLNDAQELALTARIERDVANIALRRVVIAMRINFARYKQILRKNSTLNISHFEQTDHKIFTALDKLRSNSIDSGTATEVGFEQTGMKFTKWIVSYLQHKAGLNSPYQSLFLTFVKDKENFYNKSFKYFYYKIIKNIYFSNRKFYGNDTEAKVAVTQTVEKLVTYLEELMLSGKKIVVVAHSQGNHMIELAYSVLKDKWGEDALQAIQVVGVASVASTTPSDTYITWDKDYIVMNIYTSTSVGAPLAPNFSTTKSMQNWTNHHSFTSVYMNHNLKGRYEPHGMGNISEIQSMLNDTDEYAVDDWILGLIKGSMEEAVPYDREISTKGLIAATLRWAGYDDMDLWINENNLNMVSYNDMTGFYNSSLDRDDTDGEGPEHYISDIECSQLPGKTWNFGIHQYSSGGSYAQAQFSIRIGNATAVSEIYEFNSWPSDVYWMGQVEFGQMTSSQSVPYTITLE